MIREYALRKHPRPWRSLHSWQVQRFSGGQQASDQYTLVKDANERLVIHAVYSNGDENLIYGCVPPHVLHQFELLAAAKR